VLRLNQPTLGDLLVQYWIGYGSRVPDEARYSPYHCIQSRMIRCLLERRKYGLLV
jgi:hypothetical protein